ncbi:MAG: hypothetical protein Q8N59_00855 [bacterium]|nr:hypothetical protein [bacterium]
MPEEKFEEKLFLKTEKYGDFAPVLLRIEIDKLTISARISEDKEPDPASLQLIRDIDDFLHKIGTHKPSKECDNPEKIVLFLRYL